MKSFDVIVLGSGASGLVTALSLADQCQVAILCKEGLSEGSTLYAQGGIAAVQSQEDSLHSHIEDTLIAGAGLCDVDAVKFTVEHAKSAIDWLIEKGVSFTREDKPFHSEAPWPYHLTQEGGHSKRRIIHAEDATGQSVAKTLNQLARQHPNIHIFEYHIGVDLILQDHRCVGLYALDEKNNHIESFQAKAVMLATGGASRVYLYTSNPAVSSGDGIAMAYRAGAKVANLEFNQFHPTCLYHPQARSFLITEAMRGEGALLKLPNGERFMPKFDARAELAPRDIVARAIDHEMKRLGLDHVYLDISHQSPEFIKSHFPMIYQRCLEYGFDLTKGPIPVVPAAHYTCGGVMVNCHGQTNIPGLYASGEVTYTGLHGANRMASNSLAECLVYALSASRHISQTLSQIPPPSAPLKPWDDSRVGDIDELILITNNWDEIRRLMWNYVGIVRSDKRLARAMARIQVLKREIQEFYGHCRLTKDLIELRNLVLVAELMVESAMRRKESRGLHYTLDYPESSDEFLSPTILANDFS